ncbi:MAG: hypothetical protein A3D35_00380 [Candidatus Staskawiczbacteria bacterium RIFCSPHIGHO2_02_FULL_34_9]|uniref:Uncharacterized protein n=1 Tax=Candidatus Staskawiczbacteria bacterium RIFCSPHIGHO2_02_FULL_34_9 TaxID=1802206 RepID=A0A1G2HWK0_9BACT|nr:MAG: hypothetical protein A3D35_00380 [Candidatus Staskawiczbacteria bacterium RIFCSPHIGHO2_02_FULL_34_9]
MENESLKNDIVASVKELLAEQTVVILDAVDERLSGVRIEMVNLEVRIGKKLEAMEERWSRKFDKLTTTLDKFLQRMTDLEDEFTMMKHDLNRMKKVIKEKLGVDLT